MQCRSNRDGKDFDGRRIALVVLILATVVSTVWPVAAQLEPKQQMPNGEASKKEANPTDELAKQLDEALKLLAETDKAPKPNVRPKAEGKKPIEKIFNGPPRSASVPFVTSDAIKIDGDLSDWKGFRPIALDAVVRGKGPKAAVVQPAQQRAWLAYCPKGLIVAMEVVDTSGELENGNSFEGNFWLNDCVEIYLDTLNTKNPTRGEPNTHQFFAFPFGSKNDQASGGYEAYMLIENGRLQTKRTSFPLEKMPRAAKKTETGWTMEILIPKSALRKGGLGPGQVVGFNLQIDTGTNVFYFWSGAEQVQTSMRPNTWGDVQLLGTDAKIQLVPGETADPAKSDPLKSLAPGQVFKIRVTDPDMNLDDTKKDKINVTIRAASGDVKALILEETGDGDGVFEGSIPTRLKSGEPKSGVLDVIDGDRITVEYIDQFRAAGEGNVPVRVAVPVVGGPTAK